MNFLSPDDIFTGVRRKSLCNGAILSLSSAKSPTSESPNSTPNKTKKERRRGSFNEPTGRRSSLVSRWFKHISDAAEQYKQRSKSSHEVVDDPASATLPHSNTKESLESTPERQAPSTATATTTTTTNNNVSDRESTPAPDKHRTSLPNNNNSLDIGGGSGNAGHGNSSNLGGVGSGGSFASGSRSRSISRSGSRNESNNNDYDSPTSIPTDDIKLRQQLLSAAEEAAAAAVARRDNSSLYSNNSNNTRTLMQNSPLVEPSAIQISISPAHTAEPVLTPSERLKRLDNSIRENLVEKQKIICDMFRLPIEHFNEIVDIAAQPEAPKDSSDIALAAYAQVQSLTEVLNDYMKINSTEQEISAVSTVVCDQCHHSQAQKQQLQLLSNSNVMTAASSCSMRSVSPLPLSSAATSTNTPTLASTVVLNDTAPSTIAPAIPTSPAVSNSIEADQIIHEDDDGYCEIDELRLPSVPLSKIPTATAAGTFKAPLPIGVAAEMAAAAAASASASATAATTTKASTTPELIKRQSTISTDSIPEESEQEMTQLDEPTLSSSVSLSKTTTNTTTTTSSKDEVEAAAQKQQITTTATTTQLQLQHQQSGGSNGSIDPSQLDISSSSSLLKQRNYTDDSLDSEHIEINDAYDTMTAVNKLHNLSLNDGFAPGSAHHQCNSSSPGPILCGPNRLLHANSLEPSVPCHLINGIVSSLNSQISLLLPKINERDLERERLRRENQHLRELLNAMHERQRVEANMETPAEITKSADASNETNFTTALGEEHKTTTDQTP